MTTPRNVAYRSHPRHSTGWRPRQKFESWNNAARQQQFERLAQRRTEPSTTRVRNWPSRRTRRQPPPPPLRPPLQPPPTHRVVRQTKRAPPVAVTRPARPLQRVAVPRTVSHTVVGRQMQHVERPSSSSERRSLPIYQILQQHRQRKQQQQQERQQKYEQQGVQQQQQQQEHQQQQENKTIQAHLSPDAGRTKAIKQCTCCHQQHARPRVDLQRRLRAYNLTNVPIRGDGNCQFRALAAFSNTPGVTHEFLRQQIVQYIHEHPERFEIDILFSDRPDNRKFTSVDEYCAYMSRNGIWGDAITLMAFCLVFDMNVHLFTDVGDTFLHPPSENENRSTIALIRSGEHYEATRSLTPAETTENSTGDGQLR